LTAVAANRYAGASKLKEGMVRMSPENKVRLDVLRTAPLNKWVALSEDESRIVAVGETYGEVSERSEAAGVSDPVILKTPEDWTPVSL
jgi:hypothetical protein